jgi:hypothetical protein
MTTIRLSCSTWWGSQLDIIPLISAGRGVVEDYMLKPGLYPLYLESTRYDLDPS